jgi:hypothetical protein
MIVLVVELVVYMVIGNIKDNIMKEVKAKHPESGKYQTWTIVSDFLASRLDGVEVRDIENNENIWNYDINNPSIQKDWNQTLVTAFNRIRNANEMFFPVLVNVPYTLKPLIESLVYYKNNIIDNRYLVKFFDSDDYIIYVGDVPLEIEDILDTKKPRLSINTDDSHSTNSELHVTVNKPLKRVIFRHHAQYGDNGEFQVFPHQIEPMINFLEQSKKWIESSFNEELRPESYKDDYDFEFGDDV